jgi:hypothetical protein
MSTIKSNPFKELELAVNQKAIFQPFSHEAKSFDNKKSLDLLTLFVLQDYDLHKIVLDYLESRVALNDRTRISEIEDAFRNYHLKLDNGFDWKIKQCTKSKLNQLKTDYAKILLENENIKLENEGDLVDLYSQMSEQIEGFVKAAKLSSFPSSLSLRRLITAYVENDRKVFEYLSNLWQVDLEIDISEKIQLKDTVIENDISNKIYIKSESINLWREGGLYAFFVNSILPDLKSNHITYKHPEYDLPSTQYINTLIKKFYPVEDHEKLKSDENFRRQRLLDYAEKVIEILWLNKPYFDEPIYLIRTNYKVPLEAKKMIPLLFKNNITSICIQNSEEDHLSYYENLIAGKKVQFEIGKNYIKYFIDIANIARTKDILIIAMYEGLEPKIGLIKKGEQIFKQKEDGFTLFCLQMKSVYCTPYPNFWGETNEIKSLNLSKYPVLKSLIPQQLTISPIQKNKKKIYSIYYGCPIKIEFASMSNESIETMCTEWLRSEYAPKEFKIQFQLIRTGGNFPDVDIVGCNSKNEKVACQVTNTENEKLIKDKTQKLENFVSDKKIMFSHLKTHWQTQENFNQNITEIWNTFKNDSIYVKLLERLIIN